MSKTAVVTGLSSGIGQALKKRLESDGWRVIGVSRHIPLEQEGYEVDLSMLEAVEPVATRIGEECGPIDAFFHVAGVWHDESGVLAGRRLHEFSTPQIVKTMNVGLTSAMVFTARLVPFMSERAAMVYVSGTFQDGGANWLPYYTSKRALEDFVQGLASDEKSLNIYGVSPSDTATESYKTFYPNSVEKAQPPEAVAGVCVDLINGKLSASSGTIVEVRDGKPGMGYHR
jgi:NAD(P)-dependent dehydrogenase (short-subunit alcohol dehydrogenase family)